VGVREIQTRTIKPQSGRGRPNCLPFPNGSLVRVFHYHLSFHQERERPTPTLSPRIGGCSLRRAEKSAGEEQITMSNKELSLQALKAVRDLRNLKRTLLPEEPSTEDKVKMIIGVDYDHMRYQGSGAPVPKKEMERLLALREADFPVNYVSCVDSSL
jgi:hypothetical protein